jgi:hypothetical protein
MKILCVACLVQMCHAISDKVNAELTRQRADRHLQLLTNTAAFSFNKKHGTAEDSGTA